MNGFCKWLESLLGTTIRGRLVVDAEATIQVDKSGKVVLTLDRDMRGATEIETLANVVMDDGETTEFVWHTDDITQYATAEQIWEYWDEFDERTADLEYAGFCCPQCGGDHAGSVDAINKPGILRCHGHDVPAFLEADKRKDPLYKPPCGWEGAWPQ